MKKLASYFVWFVLVAALTFLPTMAEIGVARHASLMGFWIPIRIPNIFLSTRSWQDILRIILFVLPFAMLKGLFWAALVYLVNFITKKYFKRLPLAVVFRGLIYLVLLAWFACEMLFGLGFIFMAVAGLGGF